MKHAFECNRTSTLQEYCSSESDDWTCTSTTCVLTALSSNVPSRQTGTPRGWRATEFQMIATAVHRHLTSVRKKHLLYDQTHATHKHSSHTSHTFHTNSSNTKALTTRVNIRLSQITLELFRECYKSTLILEWEQIHHYFFFGELEKTTRVRLESLTADPFLRPAR